MPARSKVDVRAFAVHSQSVPSHWASYLHIHSLLSQFGLTLTEYSEWSWITPGGNSDSQVAAEEARVLMEWQQMLRDNPLKLIPGLPTTAEFLKPVHRDINSEDLERLISGSDVLIFLEDDDQASVSSGVAIEWELLTKCRRSAHTINIRAHSDGSIRSIYPWTDSFSPEVIIPVRKKRSQIESEDIELAAFCTLLLCEDMSRCRFKCIGESREYVERLPIELNNRPARSYLAASEDRQRFIECASKKLFRSHSTMIRSGLWQTIEILRSGSLFREMSETFVFDVLLDEPSKVEILDLANFVSRNPAVMWNEISTHLSNLGVPIGSRENATPDAQLVSLPAKKPWWRFW